jgi:adenosylmethionine-8-amino-7-oxononanoate aminotransferase
VLVCGLTSYAHPLVCEAVVANIETLRDEELIPRAAALGRWLEVRLADFARTRPTIADVRGLGLLWAFELCVPGPLGARTREPIPPVTMTKLAAILRRERLHLHKRDNLLYLAPPLVIGEAELEAALGDLGRALDETFS